MRTIITDTYYVCLKGGKWVIVFSVKISKFISHNTIVTSDGDIKVPTSILQTSS